MHWGKGASGQETLSPQPYLIPGSHLLSGMQVRGFKHNPGTCPNWTLSPCQGRGLPASHSRLPWKEKGSKANQQCFPMLL